MSIFDFFLKKKISFFLTSLLVVVLSLYNVPKAQAVSWQLTYADEFNSANDLSGWNVDSGDGNFWIDTSGGFLHLESNWGPTYPIVWRNDLYSSINANNSDYAVEIRFRRSYLTGYGSAFGIGTASFSSTRFSPGDPYPVSSYENVLHNEQHQPASPGSFGGNENICGNRDKKPIPVDYGWHVGRVEFVGTTGYHYLDGSLIGSFVCRSLVPISTYFGNSYDEPWGSWSQLDIDYFHIYTPVIPLSPRLRRVITPPLPSRFLK